MSIILIFQDVDTQLKDLIRTNNEEEQLFYLKVTPRSQNPPEYRYEIIFIFNSSTTTDIDSSSTIIELDSSLVTTDDSSNKTSTKSKEKMCMTDNQDSTNADEVLAPNAKRALFQTRDQKTETRSKKKMKTDKHVEDADVLSSG